MTPCAQFECLRTCPDGGAPARGSTLRWYPRRPRIVTPAQGIESDAPPIRGDRFGRWVVDRELGHGGMGYVALAHDSAAPWSRAAIKVARTEQDGAADRLVAEGDALADVDSPYVVRRLEAGVTPRGRTWLAMEYVPGPTLRQFARSGASQRAVLDVLADVGAGLGAAHAAGVLHRDVKSSNVIVGDDGRARIVDFGLALRRGPPLPASLGGAFARRHRPWPRPCDDDAVTYPRLTEAGATMGTPAYMAPEQHLGQRLDERSDQFGFAVTAYESLAAARPYRGPTPEAYLAQKIGATIRMPSRLSRRALGDRKWDTIFRGLAPAPAGRWPELPAMVAALAA